MQRVDELHFRKKVILPRITKTALGKRLSDFCLEFGGTSFPLKEPQLEVFKNSVHVNSL